MIDLPIDVYVVMWFGKDSKGWYWRLIDEKFGGSTEAHGYQCQMDAMEDCIRAVCNGLVQRSKDREHQS